MAYQDQLENERVDAKNAVEEYVYNMRDKVEYALREFIAEEEKSKFLELLNATEEWLYDEGEDQPKKVGGTEWYRCYITITSLVIFFFL